MVKNQDVINSFVNGNNENLKTPNIFIEDSVLYSYGYHFPMSLKLSNGFVLNSSGYSMTTAKHKGFLARALSNENTFKDLEKNKDNYPNIIFMNTEQLKTLIRQTKELNINTIEDLKNFLIINNL